MHFWRVKVYSMDMKSPLDRTELWAAARLRISLAAGLTSLLLAAGTFAGEDADFGRAHQLYNLHEYKMAAEAFSKYLAAFPKSERAGEGRLYLAESLYQL